MITIKFDYDVGSSQEWRMGQSPLNPQDVKHISSVTFEKGSPEEVFLAMNYNNLPERVNRHYVTYYGDMAKFIMGNFTR